MAVVPGYTGYGELNSFMEAQAHLQAEMFFAIFGLSQAAALGGTGDLERAKPVIAALKIDAQDIVQRAEQLRDVILEVVVNVERNLGLT